MLLTSLAVGLGLTLVPMPQEPGTGSTPIEQRALPGLKPGTERWLVTFKNRSFDLSEFRAANQRRDADAVARIVADLEGKVRADQREFVELVENLGGRVVAQWWLVNGCAVEIDPAKLPQLQAHANVLRMHADQAVEPLLPIKTATNGQNHNADALQAAGIRGKGVATAIMDTGQDSSMGTSGRPHATYFIDGNTGNTGGGGIGGSRLLANKQIGLMVPDDVHGHGTGVAGIAAGGMWNTGATADHGHAPHAGIVGYAIADNTGGGSNFTTIATAWQTIATDAVQYKIVTANNSYTGSPDPLNVSQQALDACALNADVMVVVAAGNSSSSTTSSQAVVNGLAVGATNATTKTMATFSSRGPLSSDTARFYPDLCANGVSTVMPARDNEATNYVASGTSMASPQVCGAATLFRSIQTAADHRQTKAALLASTEDVSSQNSTPPYNTRNAYGMGYLKDDRLMQIAAGAPGTLLNKGTLTTANPKATFNFPITGGKAYSVAIAFDRLDTTKTTWSNLDLTVKLGTTTLGASTTTRNLYEKVVFLAPSNGTAVFEVDGISLEGASVPFGIAAMEVPPPFIPGELVAYGAGCKGTGQVPGGIIVPLAQRTAMGNSNNYFPHGRANMRYHQVFLSSEIANPTVLLGYEVRQDNGSSGGPGGAQTYSVLIGYTSKDNNTLTTSFAGNIDQGPLTTVVNSQTFNLPALTGTNSDPNKFAFKVQFSTPFPFAPSSGQNLLLEVVNSSTTNVSNFWDAASTTTSARMWAFSTTATTGTVGLNYGVVMRLLTPGGSGAIPSLDSGDVPTIGTPYTLNIAQARPNAAAAVLLGISNTKWLSLNLPFDFGTAAPGCKLLASGEYMFPLTTTAGGTGQLTLNVPNDKSLIQLVYFHQTVIADIPANPAGLVFTNAMRAKVGGQP